MIKVSAPGRADLFNTHQDYKGLPVVPAALGIRTYIEGERDKSGNIYVYSENIAREGGDPEDAFSLEEIKLKGRWSDYIKAVVKALVEGGYNIKGAKLKIFSNVPVASGLASSAALLVATATWFNYAYNLNLTRKEIAEITYKAEHDIMGIPCGRLDQYGSSFGWIIKLETRPPYNVEQLPRKNLIFVVLNSGIKHSTKAIHPVRQAEINEGLRKLLNMDIPKSLRAKLANSFDKVMWEEISEDEIKPFLDELPDKSAKRILFTLRMHRSTEVALKLLRFEKVRIDEARFTILDEDLEKVRSAPAEKRDLYLLGAIMNYQHHLLRDLYEVSLPELEEMRNGMLETGALGVKISGAGLGGALIALVENEEIGKRVVEAGISAGGKEGWVLPLDEGARLERGE